MVGSGHGVTKRVWGFDDGKRDVLVGATAQVPTLRAVVARAERRADLDGLWVVQASVRELDEMYSLVEALMGGTRSRRRLELLEGMVTAIVRAHSHFRDMLDFVDRIYRLRAADGRNRPRREKLAMTTTPGTPS